MTNWFTSDLHFGHKNIIKYCGRPWESVEKMDAALIANWNAVVAPEDEVWNLGDLAFGCTYEVALRSVWQLNGKHHFVMGNHDRHALSMWQEMLFRQSQVDIAQRLPFISFCEGHAEINVGNQQIVLCHYAMREWHHNTRGVWHLFGHTHSLLRPFGKSVDVGVDNTWEILSHGAPYQLLSLEERRALYRPVSFEELKAFMDRQPIGSHAQFAEDVWKGKK